jgi:hypothetical protein
MIPLPQSHRRLPRLSMEWAGTCHLCKCAHSKRAIRSNNRVRLVVMRLLPLHIRTSRLCGMLTAPAPECWARCNCDPIMEVEAG